MLKQLPLAFEGKSEREIWWEMVLEELRRVVATITLKEAAFACDASPSTLSHALNQRERHYVRAEWMLALLARSPDLGLAKALMEPAGLDVERKPEMSPEEELARLKATLSETLGPDLRRSIYDKAWRRD